jgi:hypothetical protein
MTEQGTRRHSPLWRLWRVWYLVKGTKSLVPPRGKGTQENPLTMDDIRPVQEYLYRTRQALDKDGLHDFEPNKVRVP